MSFVPFVVVLAVLAVIVVVLLVYRHSLTAHEDDTVHIMDGEEAIVYQQEALAKKLAFVERWIKILIAIVIIGGIVLLVAYVYLTYIASNTIRMS